MGNLSRNDSALIAAPLLLTVGVAQAAGFTGGLCNSSSNLPAYAIEDGRPSIVCIDPDGGARDRTLAAVH